MALPLTSRPSEAPLLRAIPLEPGAPEPDEAELGEDPKLVLAVEMLRRHGSVQLKAWGTSMLPIIWPGDLVTLESVEHNKIVRGDILLLLRDQRFFIHRLIERREIQNTLCWITRGDAMPHNDPPAASSEILGKLVHVDRMNIDRVNIDHMNIDRINNHPASVPLRRPSYFHCALAWIQFRQQRLRQLARHLPLL